MFKVGKIEINNPLLLAPMEDVTSMAFRKLCKEMGADIVYTEFVNSDGLIRDNKKTHLKLKIRDEERPIGIQIYGGEIEAMKQEAVIAEKENPEIIDINAGCWVKKVANRGAGAGLLKDPPYMQKMVEAIVMNQKRVFPCCVLLEGEYELNDMFVGAPVVLGKNGVEKIIEVALNDDEKKLLHDSANSVKGVMEVLDGMNIL